MIKTYANNKPRLAAKKVLELIKEEKGEIKYPIDPFKILNDKGVIITFSDFDKLEGLLLLDKHKQSMVSINLNRPVTRQRFTAAHELGHMLLHKNLKVSNFLCPKYGAKSKIEKEADEFASYLLMPDNELNRLVDKYQNKNGKIDLDECLLIAEYFGVSFESCVKTIRFRLNRLVYQLDNEELNKIISKYRPNTKRKKLLEKTNDLQLLLNLINYSYFSIPNINKIVGIKFMQNLVYHDNRLENVNITNSEINEIFADFRVNGSRSRFCSAKNQNIIEALGNIEMNKYCIETKDKISVFKIKHLNKLLYKYVPYPQFTGVFRTYDNMILGGKIQPVKAYQINEKIDELNDLVEQLVLNIEKYDISEYINAVATIHYKLTVLHPFNDGNGRISRAFMNWLLRLKGLCPIYIDSKNKKDYLKALHKIDLGYSNVNLQIIIIKAIIKTMSELHESWK